MAVNFETGATPRSVLVTYTGYTCTQRHNREWTESKRMTTETEENVHSVLAGYDARVIFR